MNRSLLTSLALLALLAFPSTAPAAHSIEHNLQIADAWAAEYPQHPNHCSGGRLSLTFKPDLGTLSDGRPAWGLAYGWAPSGSGWVWDATACRAEILEGLSPVDTCRVIAHELMHFVIGPEHVGPLDPSHPGAVACAAPVVAPAPPRVATIRRSACRAKYGGGRAYRGCVARRQRRRAARPSGARRRGPSPVGDARPS